MSEATYHAVGKVKSLGSKELVNDIKDMIKVSSEQNFPADMHANIRAKFATDAAHKTLSESGNLF